MSQQLPSAFWSKLSEATDNSHQNTKQVIKTSGKVFPNFTESILTPIEIFHSGTVYTGPLILPLLWPEKNFMLMWLQTLHIFLEWFMI